MKHFRIEAYDTIDSAAVSFRTFTDAFCFALRQHQNKYVVAMHDCHNGYHAGADKRTVIGFGFHKSPNHKFITNSIAIEHKH